jgi:hypothetical protein
MSWELLWLVVLVASFAAFTLISLLIAVRGAAEVRELFDTLKAALGEEND